MAKRTPKQNRKATATRLEHNLAAKGGDREVVVKSADLKRAINQLRK